MAITFPTTFDPGGRYEHRQMTLPAEVLLDAWMARHGSAVVRISRLMMEEGSADPLLDNMSVIVCRLCRRNINSGLFEHHTRTHRVYATYNHIHDCTFVRVDLVAPHE